MLPPVIVLFKLGSSRLCAVFGNEVSSKGYAPVSHSQLFIIHTDSILYPLLHAYGLPYAYSCFHRISPYWDKTSGSKIH